MVRKKLVGADTKIRDKESEVNAAPLSSLIDDQKQQIRIEAVPQEYAKAVAQIFA